MGLREPRRVAAAAGGRGRPREKRHESRDRSGGERERERERDDNDDDGREIVELSVCARGPSDGDELRSACEKHSPKPTPRLPFELEESFVSGEKLIETFPPTFPATDDDGRGPDLLHPGPLVILVRLRLSILYHFFIRR
jgi:hypothetical protein